MMERRGFIAMVGGSILGGPLAATAQQQRTVPHVGVLVAESAPHPFTKAFRSGMRELGYVEGRTVVIEWRYADALFARAVELATELVRLKVNVIAAHHTPAVKASMTSAIPIVMSPAGAPVHRGEEHRTRAREERAPIHHWMTSSARPSTDGGIVRPRVLAVLRLMTNS
jgi:putative ABC transport system substrate-binding protein